VTGVSPRWRLLPGVGGRRRAEQVAAVSTPQDGACWRWRIVNYGGEIVEESRETYTTIDRAIEEGSKRLTELNVVDNSVPFYPHRSTRHSGCLAKLRRIRQSFFLAECG